MQAVFGVIFHFIGGFASGSFYLPYKKVKGWAWESYWIIGGLFSWLIVPPLAAWLTIPGFADIISGSTGSILGLTYTMGLLWGIGGLTYGLGVRYLGMSLGNSVVLGFCSAFGALLPAIYYDFFPMAGKTSFTQMLQTTGGTLVLIGVAICLLGIFICGRAGMLKENEITEAEKKESVEEFSLVKGLIVAIISGILSACFNFGIEAGKSMADIANEAWKAANPGQGEFLYQNNVTYVVILWGGLTTNFIWCAILNFKILQFFFYGMGESKLGNGASSWILHMAFIILIANMWGLLLKEWKAVSKKTFTTFVFGIVTIILSVFIVGYGNSL
ncbi:MAG: rhamnose/proton symporter RhaT [Sphingobacteriales bacterium]|nr:MAG: rhamnose/proton symporter RhaT [Sphingobacteriales bacterium]